MTTFDTHAAVNSLRDAGIEERHAEAIVNTMRDAADVDRGRLATKEDLAHFVTRGEFYRALWIQAAALIGAQIAIAGFIVHLLRP